MHITTTRRIIGKGRPVFEGQKRNIEWAIHIQTMIWDFWHKIGDKMGNPHQIAMKRCFRRAVGIWLNGWYNHMHGLVTSFLPAWLPLTCKLLDTFSVQLTWCDLCHVRCAIRVILIISRASLSGGHGFWVFWNSLRARFVRVWVVDPLPNGLPFSSDFPVAIITYTSGKPNSWMTLLSCNISPATRFPPPPPQSIH